MCKACIARLSFDSLTYSRSKILDQLEPMPRTLNISDFDIGIRNTGDLPNEGWIPGVPAKQPQIQVHLRKGRTCGLN